MSQNPYDPPAHEQVAIGSAHAVFSSDGVRVVGSLARSMQMVGVFYFVVAGVALLVLGVLLLQAPALMVAAIGAPVIVLAITAGVWLREAADRFNRGMLESDVGVLGLGFVSLRKYLILFGVLGILQFAGAVLGLVSP